MNCKKIFQDYKSFLINPKIGSMPLSILTKCKWFALILLLNEVFSGLWFSFKELFDYPPQPIATSSSFSLIDFLLIILILPIIEECIFRLHLLPKIKNIIASIICFAFFVGIIFNGGILGMLTMNWNTIGSCFIFVFVILMIYFISFKRVNKYLQKVWITNFSRVFFGMTILFGFAHILNWGVTIRNILLLPLLVAPQLFLGLNCGYLRLKLGFRWGVLFHIIHNTISVLVLLFIIHPEILNKDFHVPQCKCEYSTKTQLDSYELTISESKDSSLPLYKISKNEIYFENTSIKEVFTSLALALKATVIFDNEVVANTKVNLKFLNHSSKDHTVKEIRHFVIQQLFNKYNLKSDSYLLPSGCWVLSNEKVSDNELKITPKDTIVLRNKSIKDLSKELEKTYDIECITLIDSQEKFDFILPKHNKDELKVILHNNYNVNLKELDKESGYFYITNKK